MSRTLKKAMLVSHVGMNLAIFRRPLIEILISQGVEVLACVPRDRHTPDLESMGARVEPYPVTRGSLNPLSLRAPARALSRIVIGEKPDVIHSFTHLPNILARLAGPGDGILVNSVTGLGSCFLGCGLKGWTMRTAFGLMYRATSRRCAALVFQNPDDMEFFAARNMAGKSKTALVRGSGVDVDRFHPGLSGSAEAKALRRDLGIDPGAVVVAMAGRLLRDKGVGEFLKAARILAPKHPEAVFLLVGEPDPGNPSDLGPEVIEAAKQIPNIKAPGWLDDMAPVWGAADVAVLPSYREGLPVTMQEALACGLPVVASDAPGCREVVNDGMNGLAVPVGDATALALAVETLLADGGLRARMGLAGRDKALAEFDARVLAGQTVALYRNLLERS